MKNEPAVTLTTVMAVIVAALGLLVEFGVDLTSGQQTAIITFCSAVGIVVTGFLIRQRVTPVAKLGTSLAEREANQGQEPLSGL